MTAEGVRYVFRHPGIGPILLLQAAGGLLLRPVVELLPGFTDRVFGGGAELLALLTSAIGIGAIVGGLWMAQRGGHAGLTRIVIASSALLCVSLAVFSATDALWLGLAAMLAVGFAMVAGGVGSQTLVQLAVTDAVRGRVMSLHGLLFRAGPALGALAYGAASEFVGLRPPLAVGAALAFVIRALIWARRARIAAILEPAARNDARPGNREEPTGIIEPGTQLRRARWRS